MHFIERPYLNKARREEEREEEKEGQLSTCKHILDLLIHVAIFFFFYSKPYWNLYELPVDNL